MQHREQKVLNSNHLFHRHGELRIVVSVLQMKTKGQPCQLGAPAFISPLGYPKTAQFKGRLHVQRLLWMAAEGKVNCLSSSLRAWKEENGLTVFK